MAIMKWQPLEMTESFDDIVRRAFGDLGTSLVRNARWAPALDAFVDGDRMHVRLELPGVDPDGDVEIEVTNGVLHISGERKTTEEADREGWYRREMRYGSFERHITLPDGVDPDALTASYDAGILDITIPLPTKAKTKVKVAVGTQKQLKA